MLTRKGEARYLLPRQRERALHQELS